MYKDKEKNTTFKIAVSVRVEQNAIKSTAPSLADMPSPCPVPPLNSCLGLLKVQEVRFTMLDDFFLEN